MESELGQQSQPSSAPKSTDDLRPHVLVTSACPSKQEEGGHRCSAHGQRVSVSEDQRQQAVNPSRNCHPGTNQEQVPKNHLASGCPFLNIEKIKATPSHQGNGPTSTPEHQATHPGTNNHPHPREGQKHPGGKR